ncbi:MAG: DUF4386 family protein [Bacteroidota bacterium]
MKDRLQRLGGLSAILEALIYILAFIVYGAVLEFPPTTATAVEELAFLANHQGTLSLLNILIYVIFGILLVPSVLAVHQRLKNATPLLSKLALVFGLIWAGLVIASGMIGNIGLGAVIDLGTKFPKDAILMWHSITIVTEGLGGGNEIVGGLWVLLLSMAALKQKSFPKYLIFLGVIVGTAGLLSLYPAEIFTEIFGLSQILWFLWLGIFMLRNSRIKQRY